MTLNFESEAKTLDPRPEQSVRRPRPR